MGDTMVRTLIMNEKDARLYMAGASLTRFIGFESLDEFVANTVIAVGDIETDEMVFFSNSIDRDVKHLEVDHTEFFSDYFQHTVEGYVYPEYRPQVDLFFSNKHLRHCFEQGNYNDSLSYPCSVLDDTVYIRASFELELDDESGHIFATVVLIDVTRFHSERQALATASTRDTLTGAVNRMTAADLIREYIHDHLDGPAGVVSINIDNFKAINERYDHEYGDTLLMNFVDEMQSYFGHSVMVSRTSGDDFVLFFPDTRKNEILAKVDAFANMEHEGFGHAGEVVTFRVSAGISMYPECGYGYDELLTQAVEAMHTAKLDVGAHCLVFDEEELDRHRESLGLSLNELVGNVPAAIFVYKAYGNEEIVFANRLVIDLFECGDLDDFMVHTKGSFEGVVHPDDYARVNREIWSQIRGVTHDNTDYCEYRILTKGGNVRHMASYGRLVDSASHGKVFYVVLHEKR